MRLVWCRQGLTALPKSFLLCGVLIRCDDHSHGEYHTKQCQRTSKCHHLDDWGKGGSSEGLVDTVGWRAQLYETARRPGKDLGTSAPTRVGLGWAGLGWVGDPRLDAAQLKERCQMGSPSRPASLPFC